MALGYSKELDMGFEEAEEKVRQALSNQGFGVMTKGDVRVALSKAGFEFGDYIILGACYPKYAFEALKNDPEIGLLLPCNVILYKKDEKVIVCAINPVEAMSVIDKPEIAKIALIIKEKLEKVIDSI